MVADTNTHKLLAIMFTDIVGYTAMMADNEAIALTQLALQREFLFSLIAEFDGDLIKEMGDGTLSVFNSASQAARCAKKVQKQAKKQGVNLRIGLHVGEVVIDGSDVFGDGVNLASRIESIARAGGISMSDVFCQAIKNKSEFSVHSEGKKKLKGISEPIIIYALLLEHAQHMQKDAQTKTNSSNILLLSGFLLLVIISLIAYYLIKANIEPNNISHEVIPSKVSSNQDNLNSKTNIQDPNNTYQSPPQVKPESLAISSEQIIPKQAGVDNVDKSLSSNDQVCDAVELNQFTLTASSTNGRAYNTKRAIDGKINTGWWAKVGGNTINWIKLSFKRDVIIKKIEILNGYPDLWRDNARIKTIKLIYDDKQSELHSLKDNIPKLQTVNLEVQSKTTHLKIMLLDLYHGLSYNAPGINEMKVYGCKK